MQKLLKNHTPHDGNLDVIDKLGFPISKSLNAIRFWISQYDDTSFLSNVDLFN